MKKRFLPTFVAFIVFVLLVFYANHFETDEILLPGAEKAEQIVECTQEEIKSITWKSAEGKDLKVTYKKGTDAKIVSPDNYKADKDETETVLRHLTELKSEFIAAKNATDTKPFGITETSPSIFLEAEKGNFELLLGSKSEISSSYYLTKKGSAKVYLVPGFIKGAFEKKLVDMRDKSLFFEDFGDITTIKYKNNETVAEFENSDPASSLGWRLTSPLAYNADNSIVLDIISKVKSLKVNRFIEEKADNLELYKLDNPTLSIELMNTMGKTFFVKAGTMSGNETFVTVDGIAVHGVASNEISMLRHNMNDLRDKFIILPKLTDVTEITLTDASGTINITKAEDKWAYNGSKIPNDVIKDFFTAVSRAEVKGYDGLNDLDSRKLADKTKSRKFEIKDGKDIQTWYLGELQGVNMWISNDKECVEISTSVNSAFERLSDKIRSQTPVDAGSN